MSAEVEGRQHRWQNRAGPLSAQQPARSPLLKKKADGKGAKTDRVDNHVHSKEQRVTMKTGQVEPVR
ncbi:hypothetical protein ACN6KF_005689 [Labrys sp. La1]|uniref:hypothetical protein n=1 Tax=Labrys sp. La1 TaxID=3404917 RepID=UPI003EB9E635